VLYFLPDYVHCNVTMDLQGALNFLMYTAGKNGSIFFSRNRSVNVVGARAYSRIICTFTRSILHVLSAIGSKYMGICIRIITEVFITHHILYLLYIISPVAKSCRLLDVLNLSVLYPAIDYVADCDFVSTHLIFSIPLRFADNII